MILLVALAIVAVIWVICFIQTRQFKNSAKRPTGYKSERQTAWFEGYSWRVQLVWVVWSGVVFGVLAIVALCVTITVYSENLNVENSEESLAELEDQREQLLSIIEDEVTDEQYLALLSATVPEDIEFLITNPQISDLLLGRAQALTDLNTRLFEERSRIISDSRGVCNIVENVFIPRIPFVGPECDLRVDYLDAES